MKAETKGKIYAVRTTIGQERNVADMLSNRAKKEGYEVSSILVPYNIRVIYLWKL